MRSGLRESPREVEAESTQAQGSDPLEMCGSTTPAAASPWLGSQQTKPGPPVQVSQLSQGFDQCHSAEINEAFVQSVRSFSFLQSEQSGPPSVKQPQSTEILQIQLKATQKFIAQLEESKKELEMLGECKRRLHSALADLDERMEGAVGDLRGLAGRPLAEIKRLMRCPPELVKRTLGAAWILLNCSRFQERRVRFDENKDWPRCQKMISEHGFINRVLDFTPDHLEEVPQVVEFLKAHFLGKGDDGENELLPPPSLARTGSVRAELRPSLNETIVSRTSQPCGTLVRWMVTLIHEHEVRPGLLRDLKITGIEIAAAEARCAALEAALRRLEAPRVPVTPPTPPPVSPLVALEHAPLVAPTQAVSAPLPQVMMPQPEEPPVEESPPPLRELDLREKIRLYVHYGGACPVSGRTASGRVATSELI